jgi:thiamine pyrophosphate-dependent acetolactate synthase large subunit-like protein
MQTLGVALPWAIAAALVRPNTQVVSVYLPSFQINWMMFKFLRTAVSKS